MIINKLYNTRPSIIHSPGRIEYSPLWNQISKLKNKFKTKPDNLEIVTCNSGIAARSLDGYSLGTFENSLNGIEHHVLGKDIGKKWNNVKKIELLVEFLSILKSEFVLYADSSDAVLVGDLNETLNHFKNTPCKMIFNAEKNFWPPTMKNQKEFEQNVAKPPFQYLNAGVWIGETKFCEKVFKLALANNPTNMPNSEQMRIKPVYKKLHPEIQIDDTCQIFQSVNRVFEEVEITKSWAIYL